MSEHLPHAHVAHSKHLLCSGRKSLAAHPGVREHSAPPAILRGPGSAAPDSRPTSSRSAGTTRGPAIEVGDGARWGREHVWGSCFRVSSGFAFSFLFSDFISPHNFRKLNNTYDSEHTRQTTTMLSCQQAVGQPELPLKLTRTFRPIRTVRIRALRVPGARTSAASLFLGGTQPLVPGSNP